MPSVETSKDFSNSKQTGRGPQHGLQLREYGGRGLTDGEDLGRDLGLLSSPLQLRSRGCVSLHCPLHGKVKAERRLWQHLGQHSSRESCRRPTPTEARAARLLQMELCQRGPALGGTDLPALQPVELGTQGLTDNLPRHHPILKQERPMYNASPDGYFNHMSCGGSTAPMRQAEEQFPKRLYSNSWNL